MKKKSFETFCKWAQGRVTISSTHEPNAIYCPSIYDVRSNVYKVNVEYLIRNILTLVACKMNINMDLIKL